MNQTTPADTILTTVRSKGRVITAAYGGGPYVELTFGSEGYNPSEVINVWDYETNQADAPLDRWGDLGNIEAKSAIRKIVKGWIADNDIEWPEWYDGYLENAR